MKQLLAVAADIDRDGKSPRLRDLDQFEAERQRRLVAEPAELQLRFLLQQRLHLLLIGVHRIGSSK